MSLQSLETKSSLWLNLCVGIPELMGMGRLLIPKIGMGLIFLQLRFLK